MWGLCRVLSRVYVDTQAEVHGRPTDLTAYKAADIKRWAGPARWNGEVRRAAKAAEGIPH